MKKNEKIIFLIGFLIIFPGTLCHAQKRYKCKNTFTENEFRIGARAGFELANMYLKVYDTEYETSSVFGLHGGLVAEYVIQEVVGIQSGISYFESGTEAVNTLNKQPINLNIKMRGVQIPIIVQPRYIKDDIIFFGSFGTYLGYQINGKESMSGAAADTIYSSAISFNASSGQYVHKKIDFGLSVGGGMEYNHIVIGAFYNFGLSNITTTPSLANNKILYFSVGYMFGL